MLDKSNLNKVVDSAGAGAATARAPYKDDVVIQTDEAGKVEAKVGKVPPKHLEEWHQQLTVLYRGHWEAARSYQRWHAWLGGIAAIFAAIAGTAGFTQLTQYVGGESGAISASVSPYVVYLQVAIGVFGIASAALGAAQTFFRFSDVAALHRRGGQQYGTMHRQLDDYRMRYSETQAKSDLLDKIQEEWAAADAEFPPIPSRIYEKVKREAREGTASRRPILPSSAVYQVKTRRS